jgi:hypothetical protein
MPASQRPLATRVGLCPSAATSTPPPQQWATNLSDPNQTRSPISLPSPSSPSVGYGQIVPMGPRSSERKWLAREDLKKLLKIPKIKCGAEAAPAPGPNSTFTISAPATQMPMTPPGYSLELEQRIYSPGSENSARPCIFTSTTQAETLTTTPRGSRSTGPDSTQAPTNGPSCSGSSQVVSLPITPPLTPTMEFVSPLARNVGGSLPPSMEGSTLLQGHDRLDISQGRGGAQATVQSGMKQTKEPLRTQNATPDLQGTLPLKNARLISSQVSKSSPLASTVTDSSGRTTQRVANSQHTIVTSAPQTRSPKEFNMDSCNSCDCRSNGGQECPYCHILKGAFE